MDDAEARELLEQERQRLVEVHAAFDAERLDEEREDENLSELAGSDQHQADVGTETFEREKDLSILERVEGELNDVEHALRRLDDGSYGTCEACGAVIDDDRLEAVPAARFCLRDQQLAEREARA